MTDFERQLAAIRDHPAARAITAAAPGDVFLVGGPVRDLVLGRPVADCDLAAHPPVDSIAQRAGEMLGVRPVPLGRPPLMVHRITHQGLGFDLGPIQGRTLNEDLARRDLTVNAMAVPLGTGRTPADVIDPLGGLADADRRIARLVSERNIIDDPVRMLRLYRFAAELDFGLDADSAGLVAKNAGRVRLAAGERVRDELLKTLDRPAGGSLIRSMDQAGLMTALFPEWEALKGCDQDGHHALDAHGHTLAAAAWADRVAADPASFIPNLADRLTGWLQPHHRTGLVKLALLFHDLGKPDTRDRSDHRYTFYGHDEVSAEKAEAAARRLRLSAAETDLVLFLVRHHMRLFHLQQAWEEGHLTDRGVHRLDRLAGDRLWGLIAHALADAAATNGPPEWERGISPTLIEFVEWLAGRIDRQHRRIQSGPPLVNGRDIMDRFNLPPSPYIGRLLEAVREAQAAGEIETRADALKLVRDKVAGEIGSEDQPG
jgi:tRNA nucleotidyltransferase/poly(A) polymerase